MLEFMIYVHNNVGQRNVFTNNASYTIANGQEGMTMATGPGPWNTQHKLVMGIIQIQQNL